MNGGYFMLDCTGLNLNTSVTQTVDGIYDRSLDAIASGKPVYVYNCNMSGMPCTPTCVIAWPENGDIVATGHVLRIVIDNTDGVTVTNLVA